MTATAVPASTTNSNPTTTIQYQQQRSLSASLSGTVKTADGTEVSFNFQVQQSDAVQISLSSNAGSDVGQADAPQQDYHPRVHHGRHRRQEQNFKNIDTNGDGLLDKSELETAQQARQQAGQKTPLIDRALAQFDSLTTQSGKGGITLQQFFARTGQSAPSGATPSADTAPPVNVTA